MVKAKERDKKPGDVPPNDQALGEFVRRRRKALELKVKDLAHEIGVSTSYISQVELGRQVDPSLKVLRRFAAALDVDMQTLLGVVSLDSTQPGHLDVEIPPPLATLAQDLSLDSKTVEMLARINIDAQQPTTATDWLMVLLVIRRACGMGEELDLSRHSRLRTARGRPSVKGITDRVTVADMVAGVVAGKDQPIDGPQEDEQQELEHSAALAQQNVPPSATPTMAGDAGTNRDDPTHKQAHGHNGHTDILISSLAEPLPTH